MKKQVMKTLTGLVVLSLAVAQPVVALADENPAVEEQDKQETETPSSQNPISVASVDDEVVEYVAKIGGASYATIKEAIAEAEDGATIEIIKSGTYSLYEGAKKGITSKSLTFVAGDGVEAVWNVGDPSDSVCPYTEFKSDYSFEGSRALTFKNMTLNYGSVWYRGFSHVTNFTAENCTINGCVTYCGNETGTFKNCTFNAPKFEYAIPIVYQTSSISFENCIFNGTGKYIAAYKEGSSDPVTVNFSNCTVKNVVTDEEKQGTNGAGESYDSKSAIYVKDNNCSWNVNISGTNSVSGIDPNGTTCSRLFQVKSVGTGKSYYATVKIDNTEVWKGGAMVKHAIDCTNDKYTDGYKDNAFTVTVVDGKDWEEQKDGLGARTVEKVCQYCKYTETVKQTGWKVSYDANASDATGSMDASGYIVVGEDATAVANGFTRSGYHFTGWKDQDGTSYAAGATFKMPNKAVTLYAQWASDSTSDTTPSGDSTPSTPSSSESSTPAAEQAQTSTQSVLGATRPAETVAAQPAETVAAQPTETVTEETSAVLGATRDENAEGAVLGQSRGAGTGDESHMAAWGGAAAGALALLALYFGRKSRKNRRF